MPPERRETDAVPQDTRVRLGYLVSQYPTVNHTFVLREIQTLRQSGFEIEVVSIRPPDRKPEALSADELQEYRLARSLFGASLWQWFGAHIRTAARRPLRYLGSFLYALRLAGWEPRRLLRHAAYFAEAVLAGEWFTRFGVDLVHTHFSSSVALLMARLFGLRFSATIHGPDEFNDVVGFHIAEKAARASFIATISKYGASQIMRASDSEFWPKIHVLPLGVDVCAFNPPHSRLPSDRFRILSIGRLAPAKAFGVLIAAIGRLVAAGRQNLALTIVGDGPSRPALERAIADTGLSSFIRLAGSCNHDRVVDFLRESDAFALASFAEGVPVVLMEAMAMELPCVATWITGVPELIRSEVDGILVPPADPAAVADALARLMDDPQLRSRLGQSARSRICSCYELASNTQRLAEVFRLHLPGKTPASGARFASGGTGASVAT